MHMLLPRRFWLQNENLTLTIRVLLTHINNEKSSFRRERAANLTALVFWALQHTCRASNTRLGNIHLESNRICHSTLLLLCLLCMLRLQKPSWCSGNYHRRNLSGQWIKIPLSLLLPLVYHSNKKCWSIKRALVKNDPNWLRPLYKQLYVQLWTCLTYPAITAMHIWVKRCWISLFFCIPTTLKWHISFLSLLYMPTDQHIPWVAACPTWCAVSKHNEA